jgi:hypothetical protein
MFIVKYSKGDWEGLSEIDIFITENEEYAKAYVEKFNTKLDHWQDYYENKCDSISRKWDILNITGCYYQKIEMRKWQH